MAQMQTMTWPMPVLVLGQTGEGDADRPIIPQPAPSEGEAGEQAPGGATQGPGGAQQPGGFGDAGFLILLAVIMLVFIVFSMSGQRKERKRKEAMLSSLKKGDKVQTIGGILGTIVDVRDQEVVVKVDENANTRLRLARQAVQAVLDDKSDG